MTFYNDAFVFFYLYKHKTLTDSSNGFKRTPVVWDSSRNMKRVGPISARGKGLTKLQLRDN